MPAKQTFNHQISLKCWTGCACSDYVWREIKPTLESAGVEAKYDDVDDDALQVCFKSEADAVAWRLSVPDLEGLVTEALNQSWNAATCGDDCSNFEPQ